MIEEWIEKLSKAMELIAEVDVQMASFLEELGIKYYYGLKNGYNYILGVKQELQEKIR